MRTNFGGATDDARESAELERPARQAARLAQEDAVALYTGGYCTDPGSPASLDAGATLIDRALALDPNLVAAWPRAAGCDYCAAKVNRLSSIWRARCGPARVARRCSPCRPVLQPGIEELGAVEAAHDAGVAAVAARQREFGEERGDALIEHRTIVAAGLVAEGTCKPRRIR
jgi:hypothetical protein